MKKFFEDFKKFISKGNIFNLAIGVVIGSAFSAITTSLVNDIIMPPLGYLIGGVDFKELKLTIKAAELNEAGEIIKEAVTWNYGSFIQTIINFLIISLVLFFIVKFMMKMNGLLTETYEKSLGYRKVLTKQEIKEMKAKGAKKPDLVEAAAKKQEILKAEVEKTTREKDIITKGTDQNNVLMDIRALLIAQLQSQGQNPMELVSSDTQKYFELLKEKEAESQEQEQK